MKSASLPPLRVEPALRRSAERVLRDGETLSAFVEEAVKEAVRRREDQEAFVARGLASAEKARKTGRYVSAESVLKKLEARLVQKRSGGASSGRTGRTRR